MSRKIITIMICSILFATLFLCGCESTKEKTTPSIIGEWYSNEVVMGFSEDGTGYIGSGSVQWDMEYTYKNNLLTITGKFDFSGGFFILIGTEFKTAKIFKISFINDNTMIIKDITETNSRSWERI